MGTSKNPFDQIAVFIIDHIEELPDFRKPGLGVVQACMDFGCKGDTETNMNFPYSLWPKRKIPKMTKGMVTIMR